MKRVRRFTDEQLADFAQMEALQKALRVSGREFARMLGVKWHYFDNRRKRLVAWKVSDIATARHTVRTHARKLQEAIEG